MKYAELKAELDKLSPEQLAQDVIWWGDERGGPIEEVKVLEEEYVSFGEGMEPWSTYANDEDVSKEDATARLPEGQTILVTDVRGRSEYLSSRHVCQSPPPPKACT